MRGAAGGLHAQGRGLLHGGAPEALWLLLRRPHERLGLRQTAHLGWGHPRGWWQAAQGSPPWRPLSRPWPITLPHAYTLEMRKCQGGNCAGCMIRVATFPMHLLFNGQPEISSQPSLQPLKELGSESKLQCCSVGNGDRSEPFSQAAHRMASEHSRIHPFCGVRKQIFGHSAYLLCWGAKHAWPRAWLAHLHPRAGWAPRVPPLRRPANERRPLHALEACLLPRCIPGRGLPSAALRHSAQSWNAGLQYDR